MVITDYVFSVYTFFLMSDFLLACILLLVRQQFAELDTEQILQITPPVKE